MINIDWFQLFEHFSYSVGVIYFSVLNLPRSVRYKRENIILAGIIPGPSEPPLNINSYLSPVVSELLQLWDGLLLSVHGITSKVLVKAALLGTPCDLPAGRKVCGFLSHSANLASHDVTLLSRKAFKLAITEISIVKIGSTEVIKNIGKMSQR